MPDLSGEVDREIVSGVVNHIDENVIVDLDPNEINLSLIHISEPTRPY